MLKMVNRLQGKDVFSTHQPENGVAKAPPGITQRLFELIPSASDEVGPFACVIIDPSLQHFMVCVNITQLSSRL